MIEKKKRGKIKGIHIRRVRGTRIGMSKSPTIGEKGIQIVVIRILAMRSYVERVSNLRQHVH